MLLWKMDEDCPFIDDLQMKKGWFSVAMLTYQRVHDVDADDVKIVFHLGMAIVKQIPTKTSVKKQATTQKKCRTCVALGKNPTLKNK